VSRLSPPLLNLGLLTKEGAARHHATTNKRSNNEAETEAEADDADENIHLSHCFIDAVAV
jgi:hypothetical protein